MIRIAFGASGGDPAPNVPLNGRWPRCKMWEPFLQGDRSQQRWATAVLELCESTRMTREMARA